VETARDTSDVDRLEQIAFERERYLAWQAGQLAAVRSEADQAIKALQAELAFIHRSWSWRVTRPLRVLAHPRRYIGRR
jgi:hypothetical protein